MCLPILHELMNQGVRIVVCAKPWARSLLSAYHLEGWVEITGKVRADAARVRAHKKQYQHEKTVGLIVPDSISSALVFWLAGIASAGYKDEGRSLLLKWPITKPNVPMHAVEFWYHLALKSSSNWGLSLAPLPASELKLQLRDQAYQRAAEALRTAGLVEGKYVLIAPTATGLHLGQNKTWSHYAELHTALSRAGYTVIMCPPPMNWLLPKQPHPTPLYCLPYLSTPLLLFAKEQP